jgi:hypothetical protein
MREKMNMSSKYTIADAVRTVGHLLEHHPTTGYLARDNKRHRVDYDSKEATCWCLVGGFNAVTDIMGIDDYHAVWLEIQKTTGIYSGLDWDACEYKLAVCKKLQEYKG